MLSSNEVYYTDESAQGKNFFKNFSDRRSVPKCRHKRNVPKCRLDSCGDADVLAKPASESHLRQGDVKRKGADLLVAPLKLNVRLSKCGSRSVGPLRGL